MMMLVPEAWEKHTFMDENKKAFYQYNSCIMEPWDGPASIPFTDGKYIGALLDRNGLRPSRYSVTKDGYVIMSSETGVLEIDPKNIETHGRLEPGKMFLVDMDKGRIIKDEEIKKQITHGKPYKKWLKENLLYLKDIPYTGNKIEIEEEDFETRMRIFGYTQEDLKTIITPMSVNGKEAIGSMGQTLLLLFFQIVLNYCTIILSSFLHKLQTHHSTVLEKKLSPILALVWGQNLTFLKSVQHIQKNYPYKTQ